MPISETVYRDPNIKQEKANKQNNRPIEAHTLPSYFFLKKKHKQKGPLEKGMMWSYSKQRQPWQLQKRLQTMLPAASLRHRSGWRPGTVSALAQHMPLALASKNLGLSSSLRALRGDEEPDPELIVSFFVETGGGRRRKLCYCIILLFTAGQLNN